MLECWSSILIFLTLQFDPLLKQTIHWFTRHGKYEGEETICLLESIFGGLCDEDDAALRSASANYFRCQFHQQFISSFFVRKCCFSVLTFWVCNFLSTEIIQKAAHNVLVKLTLGLNLSNPFQCLTVFTSLLISLPYKILVLSSFTVSLSWKIWMNWLFQSHQNPTEIFQFFQSCLIAKHVTLCSR